MKNIMNTQKNVELDENEELEYMEAERDFLNERIEKKRGEMQSRIYREVSEKNQRSLASNERDFIIRSNPFD